ncbi:MAG: zinc-binding dehydrogenase, partial [Chloroflexi bacterium]|nr:zinc-binding dehydrogenase [Chloroflexota bacterium]
VFELVGSDDTIAASLRMLRRQGRLVFVGYGSGRLRLNPLQLVLRETRVLSSLGNTRRELEHVVHLATEGRVHVPIARCFALEDADLALSALRDGRLKGRAVLLPAAVPLERQVASAAGEPVRRVVAPIGRRAAVVPRRAVGFTDGRPLEAELLAFVARGIDAQRNDAEFNELALRLFEYQFEHTLPYRRVCERRGRTPDTVDHWRQIPPVPIAGFKEALLAAEGTEGAAEFDSSGTTRPEHKSRHFHPSLELYNLNAALNFRAHVLPDLPADQRMRMMVLFPHRDELPNSSLAHWLTLMVERFGATQSDWFVTNAEGLQAERLGETLERVDEPVALLAASFGLVHFLEYLLREGRRIELPPGSRVMDTGGYKGRSREYAKHELYGLVDDLLGVPASHIVNMYGMTEHGTQFLDAVLRDPREPLVRYKTVPPWARTLVVDPETLVEKPRGERGLLLHFDLINRASVLAVLTEDVGHALGDGFEVLGRAEGSDARGCSIALDELIEAQRV